MTKPSVISIRSFETSALACAKTTDPPPGSWHSGTAYETFTGHWAGALGAYESESGSLGLGFGPGGTSGSTQYAGICGNWVTFHS